MNQLVLQGAGGGGILHRWFVQYNPFYFASALLVLAGLYLLTREPADWDHGQLALSGIVQVYELALIAGAALLFDLPGQRRPAVILAIVAFAFLFDVSFRTEGMASIGLHTFPAAIAWAALLGLKLALLGRALRVRLPGAHCAIWVVAGMFVAAGPQLIGAGLAPQAVLAAACWLGITLVALTLGGVPRVRSQAPLDEWGGIVLARLERLVPAFWCLLYWAHIAGWAGIYELSFTPLCFAPLLVLLPLAMWSERGVWIVIAIALALATQWPGEFAACALLLGAGTALKAWHAGWRRLYVAAAIAAVLSAWPALLPLLPKSAAHWGAVSLGAGFLALASGFGLSFWASRSR